MKTVGKDIAVISFEETKACTSISVDSIDHHKKMSNTINVSQVTGCCFT